MTINEAVREAIKRADTENRKLRNTEAKRILRFVLGISSNELIIHSNENLNATEETQFFKYVDEWTNGKPLQYITHSQEFMGLEFYVDERVLIPQPDTEVLVEEAIFRIQELCSRKSETIKVLDLCTGSGAIAVALKKKFGDKIEVTASDISKGALEVAKLNAKKILGDETKINFVHSDMFENINGKFDVIVSNPPYIERGTIKTLDLDVQNEPNIALDGGEDGLKFYRIIKENINNHLKENGYVLMEIGYNQKQALLELFEGAECIKDLAGNDRVVIFNWCLQ